MNIFKISDCVQHPEYIRNLQGSMTMITSIRNKIRATLDDHTINEGSCPEKYQYVDHQKVENPYLSEYGEDKWMDAISKSPSLRLVRPISDLINHMAIQSTNAINNSKFQGKALFYHDALSQLTEKKQWNG